MSGSAVNERGEHVTVRWRARGRERRVVRSASVDWELHRKIHANRPVCITAIVDGRVGPTHTRRRRSNTAEPPARARSHERRYDLIQVDSVLAAPLEDGECYSLKPSEPIRESAYGFNLKLCSDNQTADRNYVQESELLPSSSTTSDCTESDSYKLLLFL